MNARADEADTLASKENDQWEARTWSRWRCGFDWKPNPEKRRTSPGFLEAGLSIVQAELATTAWFGIRLGPSTFGIFDAS